ncbi:hypothetical protein LIER_38046 [Lithospermum erythrorhizon]|uniref:Secreted protein n=1 Tax=Lithospermum erythrorhizon TaxID=34254 RepID=A0AAV3PTX2_LITER
MRIRSGSFGVFLGLAEALLSLLLFHGGIFQLINGKVSPCNAFVISSSFLGRIKGSSLGVPETGCFGSGSSISFAFSSSSNIPGMSELEYGFPWPASLSVRGVSFLQG